MTKLAALTFCIASSLATPALAEAPTPAAAAKSPALAETSRILRLGWLNLRAIAPGIFAINPALLEQRGTQPLSARLLDSVVVVSGTPVLLVDAEDPAAARWGVGCTFSACTALARGSF